MTHSSHRGFSLVELMVALAISMVAMVAVTELYLGTRQTYRVQAMQSRLSEDGRFALSILQRLVSQAGYRASSAAMPSRIKALSATSLQIAFAGDGTGTIACDGSPVGVARTVIISSSNTSLQCADGADEAAATAANKTDWIAPAGGNGTELADFRIGYGMDTEAKIKGEDPPADSPYQCGNPTQDCVADAYLDTVAGNKSVVAVKLCLVLRSEASDRSITRTVKYKDCSSQDIDISAADQKLYRTFNTTVLLKNR